MATITELLEAHYDAAWNYRGRRECACGYEFTGGYSAPLHRAHVAEVLEQHMQECEERAWSAGFHKGRKTENGSHISTWPKNPYRKESSDGR